MLKPRALFAQLSVWRIGAFAVAWCTAAFVFLPMTTAPVGAPIYAALDDPPAVTQLAYSPSSLYAVDEPPAAAADRPLRIAWVSASDVIYGLIDEPDSKVSEPGYLQVPVAEELSKRLGRRVVVEAYAMPNSRALEKALVVFRALETKPDLIVVSFNFWDFSNLWISMPRYANFRMGVLARNPGVLVENPSLLPYVHAQEVAWTGASLVLPILRLREVFKVRLQALMGAFNPLVYKAGTEPVANDNAFEALAFFGSQRSDPGGPDQRTVGNERVIAAALDMIRESGIPALIYSAPTIDPRRLEVQGLEAALARYKQSHPPDERMIIEPRSLARFLDGIEFRDTNHLRRPAPAMTKYLADQLEHAAASTGPGP